MPSDDSKEDRREVQESLEEMRRVIDNFAGYLAAYPSGNGSDRPEWHVPDDLINKYEDLYAEPAERSEMMSPLATAITGLVSEMERFIQTALAAGDGATAAAALADLSALIETYICLSCTFLGDYVDIWDEAQKDSIPQGAMLRMLGPVALLWRLLAALSLLWQSRTASPADFAGALAPFVSAVHRSMPLWWGVMEAAEDDQPDCAFLFSSTMSLNRTYDAIGQCGALVLDALRSDAGAAGTFDGAALKFIASLVTPLFSPKLARHILACIPDIYEFFDIVHSKSFLARLHCDPFPQLFAEALAAVRRVAAAGRGSEDEVQSMCSLAVLLLSCEDCEADVPRAGKPAWVCFSGTTVHDAGRALLDVLPPENARGDAATLRASLLALVAASAYCSSEECVSAVGGVGGGATAALEDRLSAFLKVSILTVDTARTFCTSCWRDDSLAVSTPAALLLEVLTSFLDKLRNSGLSKHAGSSALTNCVGLNCSLVMAVADLVCALPHLAEERVAGAIERPRTPALYAIYYTILDTPFYENNTRTESYLLFEYAMKALVALHEVVESSLPAQRDRRCPADTERLFSLCSAMHASVKAAKLALSPTVAEWREWRMEKDEYYECVDPELFVEQVMGGIRLIAMDIGNDDIALYSEEERRCIAAVLYHMLDGVLKYDTPDDTEMRCDAACHVATLAVALGDIFTAALVPEDVPLLEIVARRCSKDPPTAERLRTVIEAAAAAPEGNVQRARARAAVLARLPCADTVCISPPENLSGTLQTSLCGGCKSVRYCSRSCQAQDWKRHRAVCRAIGNDS